MSCEGDTGYDPFHKNTLSILAVPWFVLSSIEQTSARENFFWIVPSIPHGLETVKLRLFTSHLRKLLEGFQGPDCDGNTRELAVRVTLLEA